MGWFRIAAPPLAIAAALVTLVGACGPAAQERGVRLSQPSTPTAYRAWAVVIGVSDYQKSDPVKGFDDLAYADDDARALAEAVADPRFGLGGVPPERLRLLIDADATLQNIRSALFEFLAGARRDDLVFIFFSGHGVPDPTRPSETYLMAHDSDPERLAATALPMAELRRALERIRADRLVLFADACHSAGLMMEGVKLRASGTNTVNKYLQGLAKAKTRVMVTSAQADQTSWEGPKWGNGVFTWALLRALRGEADARGNGDGIVQLGETIDFLRDEVDPSCNEQDRS